MQTYTLEQSKKIYQDAKAKGLDGKKVIYLMAKQGATFDGLDNNGILDYGQKTYEPKPTLGQDIKTAFGERGKNIEEIQSLRGEGKTALGEVVSMTGEAVSKFAPKTGEAVSKFAPKIGEAVSTAGEKIDEFTAKHPTLTKIFRTAPTGGIDIPVAGQVAGGVQDVIGETISAIVPEKWKEWGAEKAQQVAENALAQAGIDTIEKYNAWAEKYPLAAKNIEGAANIALTAGDVIGAGEAASATTQGLKTGARAIAEGAQTVGSTVSGTLEPVKAVAESVASTLGGAVRRGKQAVVEGVEEASRVAKLPPAEKAAVRSGLDSDVIDFVKTSSKESVPVYEKIVSVAKTGGLRNGTAAKEVVGKEILSKAVQPAIKLRDTIGKKIGAIVQKLPTEKVDITPYVDEFTKILESVGVTVGNKGKLIAGQGAVVGDLPAYQNMFNRIKRGVASQKDLHDIRSAVFKEFNLAKARQQAFSETADNVAEQFRSLLAKGITDNNYLKLSKQYSEVMQPLQDFIKLIGYKGDIEKIGLKNLKVAEVAQRVLGNAASRPKEVLEAIAKLAEKSGKGKLAKDLTDQIRFSDLMEDFYGIGQTRSFAGQTARGVKAGVEGATESIVQSAAQGGTTGLVGGIVKGVLGKTTAEQQKALEALIASLIRK